MSFERGRCPRMKYHEWRITFGNEEIHKEVCKGCGKHERWKIVDGRVADTNGYSEAHVRDFCQPYGLTATVFRELYGSKPIEAERRRREQKERQKTNADAMDAEYTKYMAQGEGTKYFL